LDWLADPGFAAARTAGGFLLVAVGIIALVRGQADRVKCAARFQQLIAAFDPKATTPWGETCFRWWVA
jgi:hypothetical protein